MPRLPRFRTSFGILALLVLFEPSLAASVELMPDAVKPAVADLQQPLVLDRVHLDGFLGERIHANSGKRLLAVDEDALLAGFRQRPGQQAWVGEHVGKWMHAATLAWVYSGSDKLREKLDRVVAELLKCQQPDGYLGTYVEKDRWTSWDVWVHKYDLIGLLTYYHYTGSKPAFESAKKIGDLLCNTFGKENRDIVKAGDHVGMAATSVLEPMVLLHRVTGDDKYLKFCRYILWAWEQPHGPRVLSSLTAGNGVNKTANGKAYELMSNLIGLCELYRTTGEEELLTPVLNAWQDIVDKRLYITGSMSQRELFLHDNHLPNDIKSNVGETCATVTWIQLNAQLLRLKDEARFAEQLERALYNHLLAAQKPKGDEWCYFTSLEGTKPYNGKTDCCLSSGPRGLALAPGFAYGFDGHGIAINFYETGHAKFLLPGGQAISIEQQTQYPSSGEIHIIVHTEGPVRFSLRLRIPEWSPIKEGATPENPSVFLSINDLPIGNTYEPGTYGGVSRRWRDGDKIILRFDARVRAVEGEHGNAGRLALMYGPLVLAADEAANEQARPLTKVTISSDFRDLSTETRPATDQRPAKTGWDILACLNGEIDQSSKPVPLRMTPFAEAGADGSYLQVWFAKAGSECAR